jgi:hypothetical protein
MKNYFIFLLLTSCVLFSCGSDIDDSVVSDSVISEEEIDHNEAVDMDDRILGVASGKLTFKYSGNWTGTETVWFDRYGQRVVIDQDIQYSKKIRQKKRLIWSGQLEGSYTCNYLNDSGEEEKSYSAPPLRVKDTELSIFAHGDKTQLHHTYSPIGQKTIFGKVAIGWQNSIGTIEGWIWRGIDLSYNNQGIVKEVQSIETIDKIPDDLLSVPDGFKMK